ncbi:hypothetical protein OAT67_00400 [Bacteriovoracaceae bacterium]|nr:hypothetical protein [Bacteriovoracaceae bacterium]
MKKILCLLLLFNLQTLNVFASAVKDFEIRQYNPVNMGLKDLYYDVRIEGLTKEFKKSNSLIKIEKEIYFKVFWLYPGKIEIEVEGLPKGFLAQKNQLISLVTPKVAEVIPTSLSKTLRKYELAEKKKGKNTIVIAKDRTRSSAVTEMELTFDEKSRLTKVFYRSPMGSQRVQNNYVTKAWSKNKWVKDMVVARSVTGVQSTKVETKYDYESIKGFGLLNKIVINTEQVINQNSKNGKELKNSIENIVQFSNHKVNENIAQGYFRRNVSGGKN